MPVLAGEEAGNERERFNRKREESLFDSSLCDYGVGLFCFWGTMRQWDYGSSYCARWVDVGNGR